MEGRTYHLSELIPQAVLLVLGADPARHKAVAEPLEAEPSASSREATPPGRTLPAARKGRRTNIE